MLKLVRRRTCFACNASPDSALLLKKSLPKVRAAVQTGAYRAYLYTLKLIGEIPRKAFGSEPDQPTYAPGNLEDTLIKFAVAERFSLVFTCDTGRTI